VDRFGQRGGEAEGAWERFPRWGAGGRGWAEGCRDDGPRGRITGMGGNARGGERTRVSLDVEKGGPAGGARSPVSSRRWSKGKSFSRAPTRGMRGARDPPSRRGIPNARRGRLWPADPWVKPPFPEDGQRGFAGVDRQKDEMGQLGCRISPARLARTDRGGRQSSQRRG